MEAKESFKIFPNPVVDVSTVSSSIGGNLQLYDLTGKLISTQSISEGQTVLNHKEIVPGIYFLQFSNMKGERITTEKIIIMK
jgi:hypothetical protein